MSFDFDESPMVSWRAVALGFGIGAVALVVVLFADSAGWVNIDFRLQANRMLFGLPLVTAVCLPVLYASIRKIMVRLRNPRRRMTQPGGEQLEAGAPSVPYEWTEKDFVPRDEPDPIDELRQYIRQRLRQDATQSEVEDELIAHGYESSYAINIVSSVLSTGREEDLEVGTQLFVGDVPAGFFKNPVYEAKLRLEQLKKRRDREADGEKNEPNPELRFDDPATPDK